MRICVRSSTRSARPTPKPAALSGARAARLGVVIRQLARAARIRCETRSHPYPTEIPPATLKRLHSAPGGGACSEAGIYGFVWWHSDSKCPQCAQVAAVVDGENFTIPRSESGKRQAFPHQRGAILLLSPPATNRAAAGPGAPREPRLCGILHPHFAEWPFHALRCVRSRQVRRRPVASFGSPSEPWRLAVAACAEEALFPSLFPYLEALWRPRQPRESATRTPRATTTVPMTPSSARGRARTA